MLLDSGRLTRGGGLFEDAVSRDCGAYLHATGRDEVPVYTDEVPSLGRLQVGAPWCASNLR